MGFRMGNWTFSDFPHDRLKLIFAEPLLKIRGRLADLPGTMENEFLARESASHARDVRRKYPRIPTEQLLTIAPAGKSAIEVRGRDVSSGGIQFHVVGCEIELGEILTVTFQMGHESVVASGRVVWATETGAWSTDVGLEFDRSDAAALAQMERIMAEYEAV